MLVCSYNEELCVFACKTSAVEFDKGGRYTGTNGNKLAAYSSIVDGKYFRTNDGARSFGFFFWGAVCSFANKMTEQELKGGQDETETDQDS